MRLVTAILLVSCLLMTEFHEGSSVKLSIFGGGVLLGLARAIRNATSGNADEGPVLVRPSSADEPELAADFLEDYDSETRFDYNYDYDPIDLNYSYDYGTAADDGNNTSESDASIANAELNAEEISFRDQSIPDFSDSSGGTAGSLSQFTQPDYDYNVGSGDAVREDDTASSTSDSSTTRPDIAEQEIDTKGQFNLTVPDYSSNPIVASEESPPINLQDIFSGIISFTTEEPQPIYESIVSNVDNPETGIENPEYIPDLESEDTFNPKYGLETIEEPSVPTSTDHTRATTAAVIVPTATVTPPVQQSASPGAPVFERAKLLAWYSVHTSLTGQPITRVLIRSGKNLQTSASKYFKGAPSKLESNSPATLRQGAPSYLFRGTSAKNIVSPTTGIGKTLVPSSRTQRKASSRLSSSVQQKVTLPGSLKIPARTNPRGIMQRSPRSRAMVSSVSALVKSTDGSPDGNVEKNIIPEVFASSIRTQQKNVTRTPSVTLQQRPMPRIPIVSQKSQPKASKGSQDSKVEHRPVPKAPVVPHKIQQRLSDRPRSGVIRKSSHNESESTAAYERTKNTSSGGLSNIRRKRTIIERKRSKSKTFVDGYLPRGVGIDLRHRDRLPAESGTKDNIRKG